MVQIHTLKIEPDILNSSCAWSSDLNQLTDLFESPYTGAVTTRTAVIDGFPEERSTHTVAQAIQTISSINSYGYSPHRLSVYLAWVESILTGPLGDRFPRKPFIISITASNPDSLREMIRAIQDLRSKLDDGGCASQPNVNAFNTSPSSRIAIELNTSCPNIPTSPPTAYTPHLLRPLLQVLASAHTQDPTLTVGLKLPPFVYATQISDVLVEIARFGGGSPACPFAFLTCTNTLGNSLLFAEQVFAVGEPTTTPGEAAAGVGRSLDLNAALPTFIGGLAGDALHALALGNVFMISKLLKERGEDGIGEIKIIGVGGVTSWEAAERMRRAGAAAVGSATLFGRMGVEAFEIITKKREV